MRRLLYLALALVLLALTGLVCVRVTNSAAYIARSRFARIHEGMPQDQVREVMQGVRARHARVEYESWDIGGGYTIAIIYDKGVHVAYLHAPEVETMLDRVLEFLGYPEASRGSTQTFSF